MRALSRAGARFRPRRRHPRLALGTDVEQDARRALRHAGAADRPAVRDHQVRPVDPVLARHDRHQLALGLDRVGRVGETEPLRQPPQWVSTTMPLAMPYACRGRRAVLRPRRAARASPPWCAAPCRRGTLHQRRGHAAEALAPCCGRSRSGGSASRPTPASRRTRPPAAASDGRPRRHEVDARVGALRRQDGGHQQLLGVLVVQRDDRLGVLRGQPPHDHARAALGRASRGQARHAGRRGRARRRAARARGNPRRRCPAAGRTGRSWRPPPRRPRAPADRRCRPA